MAGASVGCFFLKVFMVFFVFFQLFVAFSGTFFAFSDEFPMVSTQFFGIGDGGLHQRPWRPHR